jgi:type I restriction enzyme M protein
MSDSASIVQKLWNYCNVLRDDGLSYQDYLEQLTFLLFLKMADEQVKPPFSRPRIVPGGLDWESLVRLDGDSLEVQYRHILTELGKYPGMLGVVFRKAQNKIQDPAKLRRLVIDLIDREQWMTLDADVKGDAYEGLLAKNAEDVKSGAGQYFTPRPLIQAIVDVMRPDASMRVCDPAAGTGGFLLAAYERMKAGVTDPDEKRFLRDEAFRGWEIVDATARLCAMNLLLHGISAPESPSIVSVDDALRSAPSEHFEMVLTNPVRPEVVLQGDQCPGRGRAGGHELPARGLLGDHGEQAAQFRAARQVAADHQRARGGRRAGQRAVRGRGGGDHSPQAAARVRPAHPAATADRHLLRRRREG